MSLALVKCSDLSDLSDLYVPQGLYLKPIAKITISVQLPPLKIDGKSISNNEVIEKIRSLISPEVFVSIKVAKSTREFVRFEAELDNRKLIAPIIHRLDTNVIQLSGFPDNLKVRAAEAKLAFPGRSDWESHFVNATDINQLKPGKRPDTIFIQGLPSQWFSNPELGGKRISDTIVRRAFSTFGDIRTLDIPQLDPYRPRMAGNVSNAFSSLQDHVFDAYIQYTEYIHFVRAMDVLRGQKLVYRNPENQSTAWAAFIKVTFDKTQHLSDAQILCRKTEREKLVEVDKIKEIQRRREDEQKKELQKKAAIEKENRSKVRKEVEKDKKMETQIIMEERLLLIAGRKLDSIRLLTELFRRVQVKLDAERKREEEEKLRLKQEADEKEKKEKEHLAKDEAMVKKRASSGNSNGTSKEEYMPGADFTRVRETDLPKRRSPSRSDPDFESNSDQGSRLKSVICRKETDRRPKEEDIQDSSTLSEKMVRKMKDRKYRGRNDSWKASEDSGDRSGSSSDAKYRRLSQNKRARKSDRNRSNGLRRSASSRSSSGSGSESCGWISATGTNDRKIKSGQQRSESSRSRNRRKMYSSESENERRGRRMPEHRRESITRDKSMSPSFVTAQAELNNYPPADDFCRDRMRFVLEWANRGNRGMGPAKRWNSRTGRGGNFRGRGNGRFRGDSEGVDDRGRGGGDKGRRTDYANCDEAPSEGIRDCRVDPGYRRHFGHDRRSTYDPHEPKAGEYHPRKRNDRDASIPPMMDDRVMDRRGDRSRIDYQRNDDPKFDLRRSRNFKRQRSRSRSFEDRRRSRKARWSSGE